jgi:hypothetical protein
VLFQLLQIQLFQTIEAVTISNKMKELANTSSLNNLMYNILLSCVYLDLHYTLSTGCLKSAARIAENDTWLLYDESERMDKETV